MALIAGELIDEARDFHPSFDAQTVQEKILLRQLSRAERAIYQLVLEVADEVITVPEVIDLATIQAALAANAGIALPAHLLVSSGTVRIVNTERLAPLILLSYVHQHDPPYPWRPTAWVEGGDLVLMDLRRFLGTNHGWENFDQITLQLVPAPTQITDVADPLSLPDIARNTIVDQLVVFMAGRKGIKVGVSQEDALVSMRAVAMSIARQTQVGRWYVNRQ